MSDLLGVDYRMRAAAESLPAGTDVHDFARLFQAAKDAGIVMPGKWHVDRIRRRFVDLEVERLLGRCS